MTQNYLKAVFWDYPDLADIEAVRIFLEKAKKKEDAQAINWIMSRFLERGRIKDTAIFFKTEEIKNALATVKISPRARKRWNRLLEVYGNNRYCV
jgi:hypothetical protein